MPYNLSLKVDARKCYKYETQALEDLLLEIVKEFSFWANISPGKKVLLKPNLLLGAPPAKAINTHPLIVKALALLLARKGCRVYCGDSPGTGTTLQAAQNAGLKEALEGTGAEIIEFSDFNIKTVKYFGRVYKLPLVKVLDEVDIVINIAKLKTHTLTGMTAAVKNLYGCIVGTAKTSFHFRFPSPRDFSQLLVSTCLAVRPHFSIVDGIIAMEGVGPGKKGRPKNTGVILASENPFAADAVSAEILGFKPFEVSTQAAARIIRLPGTNLNDLNITGEKITDLKQKDFDLGAGRGNWSFLLRFLPALASNLRFSSRPFPYIQVSSCSGCGICITHCPSQTIFLMNNKALLKKDNCIRCYCCQEFCPQGAVNLE